MHARSIRAGAVLASLSGLLVLGAAQAAEPSSSAPSRPHVVLVHGLWADGSSWSKVIQQLQARGYDVVAAQLKLQSIAEDIDDVRHLVRSMNGPTVLVGHSYGGAVVTGAGVEPNVTALVYVAAYAPDEGEGLNELNARMPPAPGGKAIRPDDRGWLWIDRASYREAFAQDVPVGEARVLASTQKPAFIAKLGDKATVAAWKTKPSFYQVSTQDRMIPPELEEFMAKRMNATVTRLASSHASLVSHPREIAALIEQAARARARAPQTTSEPAAPAPK